MTRFFGLLLALTSIAMGRAEAQAIPAKAYPPQSVAFPGGVTAQRDLVYSTLPGFRPLTLDLYQPQANGKKAAKPGLHPLLVYVHGGGWNSGNAREAGTFSDFSSVLASVAARGYVVASINYRLSGEARFPAALMDAKSAVRWLRSHAADYQIDPTRVVAWGGSAGGQIVALLGTTCGVSALEPPLPPGAADPNNMSSDCVQGVIDWYGVTDLASLAEDAGRNPPPAGTMSNEGAYLGCEPSACAPGITRAASPMSYIEAMDPPFLIQHGEIDTTVPPKQSQKLYDALRAGGIPVEIAIYPNVAHSFAKVPFAPDPDVNKKAIERVIEFLAKVAPPGDIVKPQQPNAVRAPQKPAAAPKKP